MTTRTANVFKIALIAALSASSAALAQATPRIALAPANKPPAIPEGLKVTCDKSAGGPESSTCPVIKYDGYTTWAFSFLDNRNAYGIVTYDASGTVVRNVTLNGDRYVYKMEVDPNAKKIGIWGQYNKKLEIAWSDLPETPQPWIETVPAHFAPKPPEGMKVTCEKGPGGGPTSTTCPVIRYHGYQTWVFSFLDNRNAYGVVTYDGKGNVLKSTTLSGDRYVYKIEVDTGARIIGVWGQYNKKLDLPWSALP